MVMLLGNVPTWFFDPTNKPDYQVFMNYQKNINIAFKTLTPIDLNTVKVQGQFTAPIKNVFNAYFNIAMVDWGNRFLYFKVINISQIQENQVVEIDLELDYYLSFCVDYFDINNNNITDKVFFKRKHMNRYVYYTKGNETYYTKKKVNYTGLYLDFKIQFWLNSVDKDLLQLVNSRTYTSYIKKTQWLCNLSNYLTETIDEGNSCMEYSIDLANNNNQFWISQTSGYAVNDIWSFNQNQNSLYLYFIMKKNPSLTNQWLTPNPMPSTELWIPAINPIYSLAVTFDEQGYGLNYVYPISNTNNKNWYSYGVLLPTNLTNGSAPLPKIGFGVPLQWGYDTFAKDSYNDIIALPFSMVELTTDYTNWDIQNNYNQNAPNYYLGYYGDYIGSGQQEGTVFGGYWALQNYTNYFSASVFSKQATDPQSYYKYIAGWSPNSVNYTGINFDLSNAGYEDVDNNFWNNCFLNQMSTGVVEPMLFNEKFYEWKIKLGNIEQSVFLNDFQDCDIFAQISLPSFFIWLFNFRININYPNINFTNIVPNDLLVSQNVNNQTNINWNFMQYSKNQYVGYTKPFNNLNYLGTEVFCTPYNLNLEQELLFNFEWRNTYPSLSNNWTNYLENNHNQYELGRNLGILGLTAGGLTSAMSAVPEFSIGSGAISGLTTNMSKAVTGYMGVDMIEGDLSKKLSLNSTNGYDTYANMVNNNTYAYGKGNIMNGLSGLTGLIGSAMNYAYLYGGGMKGDKQRVPTIQGSQSMNVYLNNGMSVMWKEEYLVPWAQAVVSQRYFLNGYQLERFASFKYWYNRIYWNYIEILNITTVLFQGDKTLPLPIKNKIDDMFMRGLRIIHMQGILDNGGINWSNWEDNVEQNQFNNQEFWDVQ